MLHQTIERLDFDRMARVAVFILGVGGGYNSTDFNHFFGSHLPLGF